MRRNALLAGARIVQWVEKEGRVFTNGGNLTAMATTLCFDDGAGNGISWNLCLGDLLQNRRTREAITIAAEPSASTAAMTCRRGVGTFAPQALLDGDEWEVLISQVLYLTDEDLAQRMTEDHQEQQLKSLWDEDLDEHSLRH